MHGLGHEGGEALANVLDAPRRGGGVVGIHPVREQDGGDFKDRVDADLSALCACACVCACVLHPRVRVEG